MHIIPDKLTHSWVGYNENVGTLVELKKRIHRADVCLTDLDGTDAPSPTFRVAAKAIGASYLDKQYRSWLMQTVWAKANNTPGAESTQWESYRDTFLSTEDARKDVVDMFSNQTVRNSLFPGVEDFYKSLGIDCFYVTRSIDEVAKAYGNVLGFQGVIAGAQNKAKVTEQFVKDHRRYKNYIVKGDSDVDWQMLDVLRYYVRKRVIDSVIGVYVPKRKKDIDPAFEIQVGAGRYDSLVNSLELDKVA